MFSQGGKEDSILPNRLFVTHPGLVHFIAVHSETSFYFIRIEPTSDQQTLLEQLYLRQSQSGPFVGDQRISEDFSNAKARLEQNHPDARRAGTHLFWYILYNIACPGQKRLDGDGLDKAIAHMRNHVDQKFCLSTIAALAEMDRYHFCRRFKERTQKSPLAWFMACKIEAACFLLTNPDLSVSDITARLGLYDESHFSRIFRIHTGLPPGRYRKEHPPA